MFEKGADPSVTDWAQTIVLALTVVTMATIAFAQLRARLGFSNRWVSASGDQSKGLGEDGDGNWLTGVFVTNYGATPARDVRFQGGIRMMKFPLARDGVRCALDDAPSDAESAAPRVCNPGAGPPLYYLIRGAGPIRDPRSDERLVAFGCVTYTTVFGIERTSRFAWWHNPLSLTGSPWVSADQHNEVD